MKKKMDLNEYTFIIGSFSAIILLTIFVLDRAVEIHWSVLLLLIFTIILLSYLMKKSYDHFKEQLQSCEKCISLTEESEKHE